ncbi:diaminopimelate decarboxylase [Caminicella sporogenes]|uniref:diaminopimelate decarboxylase n=1 Tax=Caminicella sporogenes TaxID=166485 RepID=UPI00253F9C48|nr:diaminopimelate decarboxylase [Caminicella sporogenes]WIF93985.1 diaminopimelate decarboxylase [Caminicella sporogenes]
MENIRIKDGHFIFGGCDVVELVRRYGTPLYVISEEVIKRKCSEIREKFLCKYKNTRAAYASKAFLNPAMCKIIEREGLDLDVVSGGELYTAIRAEFPMEKVFFHGNNKTINELKMAIKNDVGRIVVDNLYEIELIDKISREYGKKARLLYRITPGVESKTHRYISTGQVDSKFGIPLAGNIIFEAIEKGIKCENVNLLGFHFHVGSQLFDNRSYLNAVDIITRLMKDVKERYGFITKELNTGGGYGIYYFKGDKPKPIDYFIDAIMEKIYKRCSEFGLEIPTVVIEPGRWIIGEAGITLYTIGFIKEIPGVRTYVSIDGGMTDNPRPALYGAKYEALIANKVDSEKNKLVTIAGKCCESGDILIWNLRVPKVASGDILAVLNTGAYNYSMANNYNKTPRPAVVLVNEGKSEIIVERETYDDLLMRCRVPEYLK